MIVWSSKADSLISVVLVVSLCQKISSLRMKGLIHFEELNILLLSYLWSLS